MNKRRGSSNNNNNFVYLCQGSQEYRDRGKSLHAKSQKSTEVIIPENGSESERGLGQGRKENSFNSVLVTSTSRAQSPGASPESFLKTLLSKTVCQSEEEGWLPVPIQVALWDIDSTTLQDCPSGVRQPEPQTAEVTLAA